MNPTAKHAAVFLDRDGTLIREVNYLTAIEQIEILPTVAPALKLLRGHGFKLVVVTNQSVVARGLLSEWGLQKIHAEIVHRLAQEGAILDAIFYCPHHPTEGMGDYRMVCDCRKPKTGLVKRAATELQIDLALSYLVGDQLTDIDLACAVGATGILVGRGEVLVDGTPPQNCPRVANLGEAAKWIIERKGGPFHEAD